MTLEPDRTQIEAFVQTLFPYADQVGYASLRASTHQNKQIFQPMWTAKTIGGLDYICEVATAIARRVANYPEPAVFCPPLAVFNNADGFKAQAVTSRCRRRFVRRCPRCV